MKRKHPWKFTILCTTAAAMLLAAAPGAVVQAATAQESQAFSAVIDKTTSSVVAIIGRPMEGKKTWEMNRYNLSHGTGVIIRSEGYILTNAHVVKDMRNITVVTADGKSYSGKTTHYDEESDLALVKIEASSLTPAVFASPKDLRVGESVMAIGTPLFFALRNSVTYGIISGMDRSVQSQHQLIQTDAAINPGNSGGPLVNMNGQVVGINTMKFTDFGVDNLGFAIPVGTVQHVLDHFFKYGKVKRVSLGLELGESWEAVVGLPTAAGLEVTYVEPETTAAKAGVKQGDALLSIDASKVNNLAEYHEVLKTYLPGQKVKIKLQNKGQTREVELVLEEDRTAETALVQDAEGTYIDSDQGKTRVGDSYYGWSMKYPAGLIQADQSYEGNMATFADAKGDFAVNIMVQEHQSTEPSPLSLLRKLGQQPGALVLERKYVDQAPQPYAKLLGKYEDGGYYEVRVFWKEEKLYYVILAIEKEEHYLNPAKRNSYYDLLDSFTLAFDPDDSMLKDISVYQTNKSVSTEYGLALELPAEWDREEYGGELEFYSKDKEVTLSVKVSSAASGDTLKAWADRQEKKVLTGYAEGFREVRGVREVTVDGNAALENHFATTMGDKWKEEHVLYVLKDKYKYELRWSYPRAKGGSEVDRLIAEMTESVSFPKDAVNRTLGFIQDEEDLIDETKTIAYSNKKYHYSLRVPEFWNSGYGEEGETQVKRFSFEGGSFTIKAEDRSALDETANRLEQEHKENAQKDANYKYNVTDVALAGVSAKKYEVRYATKSNPYTLQEYALEANGMTYTVRLEINDAVNTESGWGRLMQALESMTIGK
ncbi:trypsin-like peptidase domain-containing protein [Paenibacillus sp. GD4]|uniref:S1C family serine protease n=1 Tax=Paenibacillus sp. GD4 TaxID=3068890 RepID=UPI0027969CE5|nr:trypsin-like peptidase domain-containing protein [Paenibacillus sp. GD4]MDQ1912062.1 trypsin-like peptidase domain-containing protein [Paenibacillus sp. GD4]